MRNPSDLRAFVQADALMLEVYQLTASFPSEERYGLTNQLRRAAMSVPSNLAEGCSRESQADFRRFVEIALGSAMELRYQLTAARRLGFCPGEAALATEARAGDLVKMLSGLGKTLRAETGDRKPDTEQ
jgi:four helix bundle protein